MDESRKQGPSTTVWVVSGVVFGALAILVLQVVPIWGTLPASAWEKLC